MGPWDPEENPDEDPKLKLKDCWASAGDAVETTAMIPTEAMIPSERMLLVENFMFVFIVVSPLASRMEESVDVKILSESISSPPDCSTIGRIDH